MSPAIDRFRALHKLYGISLHNETALALVVVAEAIQENTEAIKACVKEIDYCGKKL